MTIRQISEKRKKKKLLIATDCFLPRWDGIARFLLETVPYLRDDYDITIIAPEYKGSFRMPEEKIKITRLPTFRFKIGDYSPSKFQFKVIKKEIEKADLIWSQTIGPIGALTILLAKKADKKVISYAHSLEWDLFVHSISLPKQLRGKVKDVAKKIVSYVYNHCDMILVPSKDIGAALTRVRIKTKKVVVPLGVDTKQFIPSKDKQLSKKRLNLDPDKIVVGYCGRIGREKNLATLFNAFSLIEKKKTFHLLIVGEGLKKITKKISSKNVTLAGRQDDVVPYLQAIDIFVMPSLTETSSLSTMEAMACGLCVVATRVGYIKHYIKKMENGLFFQKQNHISLAKKLEYLTRHKEIRKKLGEKARKTIVSKYDWKKTTDLIKSTFEKIKL